MRLCEGDSAGQERVLDDLTTNGEDHGCREQKVDTQEAADKGHQGIAGAKAGDDVALRVVTELVVRNGACGMKR